MAGQKNRYLEPHEREALQAKFEALYVLEGMSKKMAAEITCISEVTAWRWINELGLREKREKAQKNRKKPIYDANVVLARLRIMKVP